jgi:hypothetical protein
VFLFYLQLLSEHFTNIVIRRHIVIKLCRFSGRVPSILTLLTNFNFLDRFQ